MKKFILPSIFCILLLGCKHKNDINNPIITGKYVTENYKEKDKGYDWILIDIKNTDIKDEINIAISSRDDKKKPTCTFDGKAKKISDNTYESEFSDKKILFSFTDSTLVISAPNKDDENILYYFCSGGASLRGTYYKLNPESYKNLKDE